MRVREGMLFHQASTLLTLGSRRGELRCSSISATARISSLGSSSAATSSWCAARFRLLCHSRWQTNRYKGSRWPTLFDISPARPSQRIFCGAARQRTWPLHHDDRIRSARCLRMRCGRCCLNDFVFQVVMQCGEDLILHQRELISLLNQVLGVGSFDLPTLNSFRNDPQLGR